jgi:hypothetical protein
VTVVDAAVDGGVVAVTIRAQSEQLKAASAERLPAEVVAIFDRSVKQIRQRSVPSGVVAAPGTYTFEACHA